MKISDINKYNPNTGEKYIDYLFTDENGTVFCKLYEWMLLDKTRGDILVARNQLSHYLKKICLSGFTTQLYYDIIVLGLIDESQRPKCRICGSDLKFDCISHGGYPATCSKECHKELKRLDYLNNPGMIKKGEKVTNPETIKKLSEAARKFAVWNNPEWRQKHSKYMKRFARTPEGKAFYKMVSQKNSENNIKRALDTSKPDHFYDSKLYHKGVYHSNVYSLDFPYDSGWELEFIKYMETDVIRQKVKVFDRSRVSIPYKWDDGSDHHYLPDFYIQFDSGIRIVIEIKPNYLLTADKVVSWKIKAGKEYFKKKKIQYLILTEKEMLSNNKIKSSFNLLDFITTEN